MMRKPAPSLSLVKYLYQYNEKSGVFRHAFSRGRMRKGDVAGAHRPDGAVSLRIGGRNYYAHHIAWLLIHGDWPNRLDHKDTHRGNNRITNLRKATAHQNSGNHSGWKKKILPRGVGKKKGKFIAQIRRNGRSKHLGYFTTIEKAQSAYQKAAHEYFGEFAPVASTSKVTDGDT